MNLRSSLLPSLLLATFVFAACGSDDPAEGHSFPASPLLTVTTDSGELEVELRTSPQPPKQGLVGVQLVVTEAASGEPVHGLTIELTPWMGSMGHGSGSERLPATEVDHGTYEASGLHFSMPGQWELRLAISGSRVDAAETDSFEVLP